MSARGKYENGKMIGVWKFFHTDGRTKEIKNMSDESIDLKYNY